MKDETDESLLARYATGDIKAFDTLYARHDVSIYSYIKKSAKDPDVAAELTQALWEKLIKNTDSLSSKINEAVPPFALKPYLFRMAANLINDHYRLSDTKVSSAANSPSPDGDDPMVVLADDNQISPEDAGILQELSNCIERRLATVSDEFRNTFELTRDNILSYAEAAETFNLSIETIKSRVKTVLKKIRPCLRRIMTRDRELEELEQLYRSVVPDLSEAAPGEVTAKVKHAAEAHLSRLGSGKVISIGEYRKTRAFWSSIGLAAGITLGVFLGTLGGSQVSPDDRGAGMVFMGQKQALEAAKSLEGSGPEEWQKKIAEHALLGDMRTVEALSKEFNKRFPDYGKQPVDNDK